MLCPKSRWIDHVVSMPLVSAPAIDSSLHCPMCDYDLRGQIEPRCPECGYRFDWDELRDPTRRVHQYLFELHPERNVWSFVRTLLGGLRPRHGAKVWLLVTLEAWLRTVFKGIRP